MIDNEVNNDILNLLVKCGLIDCFEIDISIGKNERQSYYLLLFC